ncbi:SDR family NAD(P)-dependent oxidoreductase [Sorangium sp. So ce1036]|uniref:SDR family NAD(P)-dependent oxidoreductase n=1 Tax=Sorangium sp. So ce1036 TaxID=3133328 RepID=UPI003F05312C
MSESGELSLTKRALLALQKAELEIRRLRDARPEPIAIIGVGCRIPGGATSPARFWDLLEQGFDALAEIPAERRRLFERQGARSPTSGGFLDQIDRFDPAFFSISPREAISMDPAQRLLLEVSVEALEDGGVPLGQLRGTRTGNFMGFSGYSGYGSLTYAQVEELYAVTGLSINVAAGRISYVLDLQGPCVSVDTACCSSLVAVHLACQSLRNGECDLALAGGVNVIAATAGNEAMAATGALSATGGRCRTFDAAADGYIRSEGCGVVILKRLSDAMEAGDRILGVVAGSAVKHDGHSNGLTAPNGRTQQQLLREALSAARVQPEEIDYIETHGTGTPLGDPIELEALLEVFGSSRGPDRRLMLGSVKTNVGHPEGAAGIVGLIKVLGMFQRGMVARHLHFNTPNPRFAWDAAPFLVPRETLPWPAADKVRVAGVSAFGFSGTISHAIVTAPPRAPERGADDRPATEGRPLLLPISARTPEALRAYAAAYLDHLSAEATPEATDRDVAYTASLRRDHHEHRLVVVGSDRAAWRERLRGYLAGEGRRGLVEGTVPEMRPRLAFVFCGQGPQWWGMGRQLLEREPVFRGALEACHERIREAGGPSLLDELQREAAASRLNQTEIAQPALFALQTALAALWRSWGVQPDAVVGHSIGEVAAAHVAGALRLEDAARLVVHRGRIMQRATGLGKMLSVALPLPEARRIVRDYAERISIGASNGPTSTVLSGEAAALEQVVEHLQRRQIEARWLPVDYAFHSAQMEGYGEALSEELRGLAPSANGPLLMSTVTGAEQRGPSFDADYWGQQIRRPVLFAPCVEELSRRGYGLFLEIGPHPVLSTSILETLAARDKPGRVVASLRRQEEEVSMLLESLGQLHCAGYPVDWSKQHPARGRVISLPTYPWQRESYWLEGARPQAPRQHQAEHHHVVEWRLAERARPVAPRPGGWLILADSGGRAAALQTYLESRGHACVRVTAADTYARRGARDYQVNPREPDHFARLLGEEEVAAALAASTPPGPRGVVHLWSADGAPAPTLEAIRQAQALGSISALHLVQALARAGWRAPPRLWLVTQEVQSIQDPTVSVAQAPVWGFGATVALEMPELECTLLDLDAASSGERLGEELLAADDEDRIALRGAERYVARLVPYAPAQRPAPGPLSFDADATYLLTGGLGGIGLVVLEWMAARGARHFALLGRSGPSPSAEQVLDRLREGGAEVRTFSVDVADRERLRAALEQIQRTMPPLAGVLHAAGVGDQRAIPDLDGPSLQAIGRPKVDGAWNLHELTKDLPLDSFVLFSSVSSLFGSHGQSSYAAGNAFLDALAHHRRAHGLPALSLNWTAWTDVGMATPMIAHTSRYLATQGMGPLPSSEAIASLEQLFRASPAQIAVVPLAVPALPRRPLYSVLSPPAAPAATAPPVRASERIAARPPGERQEAVEGTLRELFARALRMPPDKLKPTEALQNLGVDSLIALELRRRVDEELGVKLLAAEIAKVANLRELSQLVTARFDALHHGASAGQGAQHAAHGPLTVLRPVPQGAALRLVCFPASGGAAADFAEWAAVMPDGCELVAVEYPGSGARQLESCEHPLAALTLQVAGALVAMPRCPLVLFGHSLGALIAHATAVELERHAMGPTRVVLSNPANVITVQRDLTREQLRDKEFLTWLARSIGISIDPEAAESEATRRFLKTFGDQLAWTYDFDLRWRVSCPVVVTCGRDDTTLHAESLEFWRRSGGALEEWSFAGAHDYIRQEFAGVVSKIMNTSADRDRT